MPVCLGPGEFPATKRVVVSGALLLRAFHLADDRIHIAVNFVTRRNRSPAAAAGTGTRLNDPVTRRKFLMRRINLKLAGSLLLLAIAAGCAHVAPTERGVLARPDMQFDADVAHIKVVDQIYAAREAASGGRVTGGGGCGCTM